MKKLLLSVFALCSLFLSAQPLPSGVRYSPRGALEVGDLSLSYVFYTPKWISYIQDAPYARDRFRTLSRDALNHDVELNLPGYPQGRLKTVIKPLGKDRCDYHADIEFQQPVRFACTALRISLPIAKYAGWTIYLDGKAKVLPPDYTPKTLGFLKTGMEVSSLKIPGVDRDVEITGKLKLWIQDNRAYTKGRDFVIRITADPSQKYQRTALNLTVRTVYHRAVPLSLVGAVNMGFKDQVSDDMKGGWTDQGPENDLGMLPTGKQRFNGIDFDILNPQKNGGKSCIVLAGRVKNYFPTVAKAVQPHGPRGRFLYVLHGLAWPAPQPIGTITVTYADGTDTVLAVRGGQEVHNWWQPRPCKNGEVAWVGENKSSFVGLYRSCFAIQDKPIASVTFTSDKASVWGIVAASVANRQVPKVLTLPYYVVKDKHHRPIHFSKDVIKGSALDFSYRLDAPAGKYGPVVCRDGHFQFRDRPGKNLRFYGTNICGQGAYPTHEWAERLAERLAAQGFNAIRLHHHDGGMTRHRVDSTKLDPENIDRLDYLVYCLKKKGIYITTDLYISRRPPAGEIPEYKGKLSNIRVYKGLFWILDSVYENWKAYCTNYLNHVNPYTKLAIKDDPVLISINVINEGNIWSCWNADNLCVSLYTQAFEKQLAKDGKTGLSRHDRQVEFDRFLVQVYERRRRQMVSFLREQGLRCPLSDQNMGTGQYLTQMRNRYDYVDTHAYSSHPSFPVKSWTMPAQVTSVPPLKNRSLFVASLAPCRIYGKPFTVTEYDCARPNIHRAQAAPFVAAMGAQQGWDALFHFAYTHSLDRYTQDTKATAFFDMITDPVKLFSYYLGAALFMDEDFAPAESRLAVRLPAEEPIPFTTEYPRGLTRLAFMHQVGTLFGTDSYPGAKVLPMQQEVIMKRLEQEAPRGVLQSANGRIRFDEPKQVFIASAPTAEAVILPPKEKAKASFLEVENVSGDAVVGAISLDRLPLAQTRRILLLHLTNTFATKMKFSDRSLVQIEKWGEPPFLAVDGVITVRLPHAFRCHALDSSGKRLAEIKPTKDGTYRLSVFNDFGNVMLYELVR